MKKNLWLISLILGIFLVVTASGFLRRADSLKSADWYETRFTYLPSGKLLKPILLGHHQGAASLLWVKAMMYFAEAYLEGKGYPWLAHIINIVITLDPDFEQAYKYGGLILSDNPQTLGNSAEILEKGVTRFPANSNLRMMAAMNRLSLDSNYRAAAEILKPVALDTSAPPYMRTLASTLMDRSGDKTGALAFMMQSYLATGSPLNREILIKKMANLFGQTTVKANNMALINRIMLQVETEPQFFSIAQKIIKEYLTDNLSNNSKKFLDFLTTSGVYWNKNVPEREISRSDPKTRSTQSQTKEKP